LTFSGTSSTFYFEINKTITLKLKLVTVMSRREDGVHTFIFPSHALQLRLIYCFRAEKAPTTTTTTASVMDYTTMN